MVRFARVGFPGYTVAAARAVGPVASRLIGVLMRYKYVLFVLLLAGLLLVTRSQSVLGCFGQSAAQDQAAAPDFSVTRYTDDGKLSLADLRGNVVLLYFWFPT